jgi:hypothetical protein
MDVFSVLILIHVVVCSSDALIGHPIRHDCVLLIGGVGGTRKWVHGGGGFNFNECWCKEPQREGLVGGLDTAWPAPDECQCLDEKCWLLTKTLPYRSTDE